MRAAVEPSEMRNHPPEPLLGIRLQCARRADRRGRALSRFGPAFEPQDRQRGDELQLGVGHRERATFAASTAVEVTFFLVLAIVLLVCFFRAGGPRMLKMMNKPARKASDDQRPVPAVPSRA